MSYFYGSQLMKELTPYDVKDFERKIRIGSNGDGGYVVPVNILPLAERVYSYGVGDNADFEEDIFQKTGVPLRMYDHSIESAPVVDNKNVFFKKEGIAERKYGSFNTFENHIKENGDTNKKVLLKMDIEGNEWKVIDKIVESSWSNIVAIILEIHGLYRSERIPYYIKKLRRVNSRFTLVHIHGNNNTGLVDSSITYIGKKKIPSTLELTFINNVLVKEKKIMPDSLPSKFDKPNIPYKNDIKLDFWK